MGLITPITPGSVIDLDDNVVITANVLLNPLEVLTSAPTPVTEGEIFTVDAIIQNNSENGISKATAVIYLPINVESVKGKTESKPGNIAAYIRMLAPSGRSEPSRIATISS